MDERDQLRRAIAYLETQRSQLGDALVDTSTTALREKLAGPCVLSRPGEELRLVTVLFADLAGWSELGALRDPEDLQAVQQAFFAAVTPPIHAHGGSVEKYIGDAVLAVFGVPEAHEDDAERALRAALAMQQAMAGVQATAGGADQGADLKPAALRLRIGIHTGMVVSRVDEAGGFVVTGDVVNVAFRLQEAAPPGSVLVSDATSLLVSPAFVMEPTGPLNLRGRDRVVAAHRVLRVRPGSTRMRGTAGLESPLVGRRAELAALQQALRRLDAGRGGLALVVGEAGVGKSRLVAELHKAAPAGFHWVEGRCHSFCDSDAYHLWLGLLRGAVGAAWDQPVGTVAVALQNWVAQVCPANHEADFPYLAHLLALPLRDEWQRRLDGMGAQAVQQHTFAAMEEILACAVALRPIVMVCEDLQWADSGSMALLERVAPLVERAPLLLICLFRPEPERSHPTWRMREMIRANPRHLEVELWPLPAADSEAMLAALLGDVLPARLAWRILGQAEGNPLYIEEIVRSLITSGALVHDVAGHYCLAREVEEIVIPESLQSVLAARIDRLQHEERRVLQLASVVGRVFLHRVLEAIAREVGDLDASLRSLELHDLIRVRPGGTELEYGFRHALIHEAAYNGMLRRQRQEFHRQTAEALERLYPRRIDEMLGLLAVHWEHSDSPQRAVDYLLRAGDRARLGNACEEAIDAYRRALALLRQQGDEAGAASALARLVLAQAAVAHDDTLDMDGNA